MKSSIRQNLKFNRVHIHGVQLEAGLFSVCNRVSMHTPAQQAILDFGEQKCLFVRVNNNSTVCVSNFMSMC